MAIPAGILLQRALTAKANLFVEGDRSVIIGKHLQFETPQIASLISHIEDGLKKAISDA